MLPLQNPATQTGFSSEQVLLTLHSEIIIIVSKIEPSFGPIGGGTQIRITGNNFKQGSNGNKLFCRFSVYEDAVYTLIRSEKVAQFITAVYVSDEEII